MHINKNILTNVNMPELAKRLFYICCPWTDVKSHPKREWNDLVIDIQIIH